MIQTTEPGSFYSREKEEYNEVRSFQELRPEHQRVFTTNPHHCLSFGTETWCCAWAPDASYFAWSSGNRVVQLIPWDAAKGCIEKDVKDTVKPDNYDENQQSQKLLCVRPSLDGSPISRKSHKIDCGSYVWSLAFGSGSSINNGILWRRFKFTNSMLLVTGLHNGKIKVWDCSTGNILLDLVDHKDIIRGITFAPSGFLLFASCSLDGTVKLWDLNDDGNMKKTLKPYCNQQLHTCKWSPNGKMIAAAGLSKIITIWTLNPKTFAISKEPMTIKGHFHEIMSCDFSPDSSLLATASFDTRVFVWDLCTGDEILRLGHMFPAPRLIFAGGANEHYVRSVIFGDDGLHLTTVCDDGYIRFWDLSDPSDPTDIGYHHGAVTCAICPQSTIIATGDRSGAVKFFKGYEGVSSLENLCRITIRKMVSTQDVEKLCLPARMKDYLKFRNF